MSRRRKITIITLVLTSVAVVVPIVYHFYLRAAEMHLRAELQARGMIVELARALPPPVSSNQDGTPIFLRAAGLMKADETFLSSNSIYAMRPVAPGKAMAASQQPVVRWFDSADSW